jgi:hypothetical protein
MAQYPIHKSIFFDVREFVDEKVWNALGVKSAWLIDPNIVRIADIVRKLSNSDVTVNNWHIGGNYKSSGYRGIWDSTGATMSQHRCGRASDLKVKGLSPVQILHLIMANKSEFISAGLTVIEDVADTPTWLHVDCRPRLDDTSILIVKP